MPANHGDLERRLWDAADELLDLPGEHPSFASGLQEDRRTADSEPIRTELVRWLQRAVADATRRSEPDIALTRWQRALAEVQSKPVEDFHAVASSAVPWFPHGEANPYAEAYLRSVTEFTPWTELRGDVVYDQLTSQQIRRQAYDLYPQVWAVCSSQSPYFRHAERVVTVLAQLDRLLHLQRDGDYNAGRDRRDENMTRFTFAILSDAYWLLVTSHPRLLPAALRASWEQQIRADPRMLWEISCPSPHLFLSVGSSESNSIRFLSGTYNALRSRFLIASRRIVGLAMTCLPATFSRLIVSRISPVSPDE